MDKERYAKEVIFCNKCKSSEIVVFKRCHAILSAVIDKNTKRILYLGESDYDEYDGLFFECKGCNNMWKSRKYNCFDELESPTGKANIGDE